MAEPEFDHSVAAEERRDVPPPGPIVRRAREQRSLSVAELSARTRLSEAVIQGVENDRFEALGQPVYARGYYRKCAEVLGLNGELLVDAYEQHSGHPSPVPTIQQRPSISYREGPGPLAIAVACVALAALLGGGAWWLLLKQQGTPLARVEASEPPPDTSAPTPASVAAPAVMPQENVPPASEQLASTPPPAAPDAEESAVTPLPVPRPAQLRLELSRGDSWVDVKDSEGTQLIYKLLPRGETIEVSGMPPFEVYLGRGDVVDISLNGRAVDFSAQVGEDLRTRFRIGKSVEQ